MRKIWLKGFFVGIAFAISMNVAKNVEGAISLPFSPGETWYVCNGYNGYGVHATTPVLDLSVDPHSPVEGGCDPATREASSKPSRFVRAPSSGTITTLGRSDMICLSLDGDHGSLGIGHLIPKSYPEYGTWVSQSSIIGTIAGPENSNNNYAHIHIQAHSGKNCTGALVPFDDAHGMKFIGAPDMTWDTTIPNQHSGVALQYPAWHPNGNLLQDVSTGSYWRIEKGKRWLVPAQYLLYPNYFTKNIVDVSPSETACYSQAGIFDGKPMEGWQGFAEGDMVRFNGDPNEQNRSNVYIISEGRLRWLRMSANEFTTVGYKWESIHVLGDAIPWSTVGDPVFRENFQTCQNKTHPTPMRKQTVFATHTSSQPLGGSLLSLPPKSIYFSGGHGEVLVSKDGTILTVGGGSRAFTKEGTFKWNSMGGSSGVLIGDTTLLTLGCDDVYYALFHVNTVTGTVEKTLRLTFIHDSCGGGTQFTYHNGTAYVPNASMLYAVDVNTGLKKWELSSGYGYQPELFFTQDMALSPNGDTLYVPSQSGELYAISTSNGSWKWPRKSHNQMVPSGPIVAPSGMVYVTGSQSGNTSVYGYHADGSVKWAITLQGPNGKLKGFGPKQNLYVKNNEALYALEGTTGRQLWQKALDTLYWENLSIAGDGTILVLTHDLVVIDPQTGNEIERVAGGFDPLSYGSNIAFLPQGGVAFVAGNGYYYELHIVSVPYTAPPSDRKLLYGEETPDDASCQSGYSALGPDTKRYCVWVKSHCGEKGTEGVLLGGQTIYQGLTYQCLTNGWAPLSGQLLYGMVTPDEPTCQSGYAALGPYGKLYCVWVKCHCGRPGTEGVFVNDSYVFEGRTYTCIAPNTLTVQ